jgi:tRNA-dihydrouridine synthase A
MNQPVSLKAMDLYRQTAGARFSIAPMVDRTDRHFRHFLRLLAPQALLYTEMLTTGAILRGDRDYLLGFESYEHPISLQIAGDDEDQISRAVEAAEPYGYEEYNLNVGCPSDKVQEAHYGACLMADPDLVARLVRAMQKATDKRVTVKHRIGIKGRESYQEMKEFVLSCMDAGIKNFSIHARIAILEGLSPKDNREIPPLRYEDVYRLKQELPQLWIEINGGVKTPDSFEQHLKYVDGVMIGRAAYENPYLLTRFNSIAYGLPFDPPSRREIILALMDYVQLWQKKGLKPHSLFRHYVDLFAFLPGARKWKRLLSPPFSKDYDGLDILAQSLNILPESSLDSKEIFYPA